MLLITLLDEAEHNPEKEDIIDEKLKLQKVDISKLYKPLQLFINDFKITFRKT